MFTALHHQTKLLKPFTFYPVAALCFFSLFSRPESVMSFAQANNHRGGHGPRKSFSADDFTPFRIRKIEQINHDSKIIEFELPDPNQETGYVTTSAIGIRGPTQSNGEILVKPYTPISINKDKGYCELLVKVYPDGPMSSYIDTFKVGDMIEVTKPKIKMNYSPNMKKSIGMVAGGTGLAPMLQVIREILSNPQDKTTIHLLFANRKVEDILLKDELDRLAKLHPSQFQVTYLLSREEEGWKDGYHGHVTAALLHETMPTPSADSLVLVCGTPGFVTHVAGNKKQFGVLGGLLKTLGYEIDMVHRF